MGYPKITDKRFCYGCGSDKTFVNKQGNPDWFTNRPTDLVLCNKCRSKYIVYPLKRDTELLNTKYIRFHKRQIYLGYNPRKGICSHCGKRGKTTMHHRQYHEDDPLKDAFELCRTCHIKEDWQLGKYANRPNNHQPKDKLTGRFISRLKI